MDGEIKNIEECNTLFEWRKQFSTWHFDPKSNAKDEIVYNFCHFEGDWESELESLKDISNELPMDKYKEKAFKEAELFGNHAKNYYSIQQTDPSKQPKLYQMSEKLGLDDCRIRIHCQNPGQLASWHMDKAQGPNENRDPKKTHRLFIFLQDWNFGQVVQIGNKIITHWKKGDTVWYRWQDLPHGTANFGHHQRFMMVITGTETERFMSLLKKYQNFKL